MCIYIYVCRYILSLWRSATMHPEASFERCFCSGQSMPGFSGGHLPRSPGGTLTHLFLQLESQWPMIAGYFVSTMGYFGVWWPMLLGFLAFQADLEQAKTWLLLPFSRRAWPGTVLLGLENSQWTAQGDGRSCERNFLRAHTVAEPSATPYTPHPQMRTR